MELDDILNELEANYVVCILQKYYLLYTFF
jgi:hypothetical protein